MLIRIGATVSIMVQHIQRRGQRYYFYRRVPKHLVSHYGKQFIRKSLGTSDREEAIRRAEPEALKYEAEFKVLSDGKKATPDEVAVAGRSLAEQWDLDGFIDYVINPAREKYAKGDEDLYDSACPSKYLAPHELDAWKRLANPNAFRLSDALQLYLKPHQRGSEQAFIDKTKRDWDHLIGLIGDIEFAALKRQHVRALVLHLIENGKKTTTVPPTPLRNPLYTSMPI